MKKSLFQLLRRTCCTAFAACAFGGAAAALAQNFERNSASNIFGSDGPSVQVYGDKKSGSGAGGEDGIITNPHAGRLEFLEAMCDQLGPKSTTCQELENLRGEGSNSGGGTRHLGMDPGQRDDINADSEDELGAE